MHDEVKKFLNEDRSFRFQEKLGEDVNHFQLTKEYQEAVDVFPALHKYKNEHTLSNFKKLCVEISDFCQSVYASTQNEEERKVYFSMLEKLKQKGSA